MTTVLVRESTVILGEQPLTIDDVVRVARNDAQVRLHRAVRARIAGSRSGRKRKAGYEGGQNPIHMRMRKLRGPHKKQSMPFENFRTKTQPVNLSDLEERFDSGAEVTLETLKEKGLAKRSHPVKVLARGEIKKKLTVHAHAFSAAAKEKIEAAGGSCHTLEP